jgi:hypothetical protein
MEVVLKTHNNFVIDVGSPFSPIEVLSNKVNDYLVMIRAFSLTRNIWIKDSMPLSELMQILRKENHLAENLKHLYFTMIRDAAIMLSHKIVFSGEAKSSEIKKQTLTYDLKVITETKEGLEMGKKVHLQDLQRLKEDQLKI